MAASGEIVYANLTLVAVAAREVVNETGGLGKILHFPPRGHGGYSSEGLMIVWWMNGVGFIATMGPFFVTAVLIPR